ncbi:hypothetical protein ACH4PX_08600 [Streptomyces anulatus]
MVGFLTRAVDRVVEVAVSEGADGGGESPLAHHLVGDEFALRPSEVVEQELGCEVMLLLTYLSANNSAAAALAGLMGAGANTIALHGLIGH